MSKYRVSHPGIYYLSIASLAIILVLCGFFVSAVLFSDSYTRKIKEEITLVAELKPGADDPDISAIVETIKSVEGIQPKSVQFVTADEALEEALSELGSASISEGMSNPFTDMVQFSLQAEYVDHDSIARIEETLVAEIGLQKLIYPSSQLDNLFSVFRYARFRILVFMGIALLMAGLLIHHIIRLNVVAQSRQIRTMELVGARPGFIRRPYLQLGIRMGLWAWAWGIVGLLFLSLLILGAGFTFSWLANLSTLLGFVLLLVISIGICWLSSLLAVNQNLGSTFRPSS